MNLFLGDAKGTASINNDGDPIGHGEVPQSKGVQRPKGFPLNYTGQNTAKKDVLERFLSTFANGTEKIGPRRGDERVDFARDFPEE